jgi:chromatin modification-related protein VID21
MASGQLVVANRLRRGRYFRDETLPIPATPSINPLAFTLHQPSSSSGHVPSPLSPGSDYPSKAAQEQAKAAASRKDGAVKIVTHTPPRSPVSSPKSDDESMQKLSPVVSKPTGSQRAENGTKTDGKDKNGDSRQEQEGTAIAADVSSPSSSTAGAQSTFTPKALNRSPDTSPEAEAVAEEAAAESQKVEASEKDDDSPDTQLRMEEAQANAETQEKAQRKRPTALEMPPPLTPKHGIKTDEPRSTLPQTQSADVEMKDASPQTKLDRRLPTADITPGRMTTRVASGAIRQKSVSEILGEAPKQSPHGLPSPLSRRNLGAQTPQTPDGFDRSRMSTVVFSKDRDPTSSKALLSELDGYLALKGASLDPERDYLRPLFVHSAWGPPRSQYLADLLMQTKKTVTSSDIQTSLREMSDYRIVRRIYQMQNGNKWSLRQLAKFQDPPPGPSHLDHLLDEMKWMRTDFREEKRWKQIAARNCAEWCADYVNASVDQQERLRIRVKATGSKTEMVESPPELIHSGSTGTSEASEEELPAALVTSIPPHALFSLGYSDLIFNVQETPAAEALMAELPMYDPKSSNLPINSAMPMPNNDNMSAVSKMVTGKLVPKLMGHPRKRSRYEHEQSDDDAGPKHKRNKSTSDPSPFLSPARRSSPRSEIPPEEEEAALFNPINKHILDRLRANHAFRPPSEFPMPSLDFFEARPPSQWTWDEDQRLRHCVRKYSFNWSLIAMDLQAQCQPSRQLAGSERRTPWECFERWFQLEGLPNDMSKTPYFKTYQGRLDQANKQLQAQAATLTQQAQSTGTPIMKRRTSCQPVRVDRRRDSRHVTMVDALRKLTRKRENNIARQNEGMYSFLTSYSANSNSSKSCCNAQEPRGAEPGYPPAESHAPGIQ